MRHEIITGAAEDVLPALPAKHYHSVFCDPPYGLSFMGESWDHGVPSAAVWAEVLRVSRPGAHLLAFGGTRTFHRLVCAVEDAGWEIRDVLLWVYGSGFPKSLNLGDGYGTALKPAYEPIVLARKPLDGTVVANVQKWGCGALWIDGGRISTEDKLGGGRCISGQQMSGGWERPWMNDPTAVEANAKRSRQSVARSEELGRWPANVLHDGLPDAWAKYFYCAKASQKERNAGCEGLPMRTAGDVTGGRAEGSAGLGSPRAGAGRTAGARNIHPTVKPLDLCRYLATLILPPAARPQGPRRLLVPFSGSGSEMIGALRAGWDDVTGIEREAEYCEIARARLAHWTGPGNMTPARSPGAAPTPANDNRQGSLLDLLEES